MNNIIPVSTKTAAGQKNTIPPLTIGIDLGDRWSQLCFLNAEGEILEKGRLKSSPHSFRQRFEALAPARIAIEAGTYSPWVQELLTELGHEVLVANARELRAISTSDRKNDQADAEKLARYARVDPSILRPITHRDSHTQADLLVIRARAALVRMRSRAINAVRGLIKPFGHRLSACSSDSFVTRCRTELPSQYYALLAPLLEQIASLTKQIHSADQPVEQLTKAKYPEAAALQAVPGVGPLTALTFVLTIGDEKRFIRSRDVGCDLGLRLRQQQSGERDPQFGNDESRRWLLAYAAGRVCATRAGCLWPGHGFAPLGPTSRRTRREECEKTSDRRRGSQAGRASASTLGDPETLRTVLWCSHTDDHELRGEETPLSKRR